VGAEKSVTLCGLGVFVEEPAEPVVPDDFGIGAGGLGQRPQRAGLFPGPMGPVSIELEYGIEGAGGLGIPVAEQEPELAGLVAEVEQEITRLLGDPTWRLAGR
jgi:hypothetical protein